MSDLIYLLSVLVSLGVYVVGAVIVWAVIEGIYWIYCKATGRQY